MKNKDINSPEQLELDRRNTLITASFGNNNINQQIYTQAIQNANLNENLFEQLYTQANQERIMSFGKKNSLSENKECVNLIKKEDSFND